MTDKDLEEPIWKSILIFLGFVIVILVGLGGYVLFGCSIWQLVVICQVDNSNPLVGAWIAGLILSIIPMCIPGAIFAFQY